MCWPHTHTHRAKVSKQVWHGEKNNIQMLLSKSVKIIMEIYCCTYYSKSTISHDMTDINLEDISNMSKHIDFNKL